jgi:hypothetical protein
MLRGILEVIVSLLALFAWVTGQLDPLQKKLQDILLDVMGETKVSYGLKSAAYWHGSNSIEVANNHLESLTGKKLVEDRNLSKLQDQLGSDVGGIFGKGGLGHGLGAGLSKNLWSEERASKDASDKAETQSMLLSECWNTSSQGLVLHPGSYEVGAPTVD